MLRVTADTRFLVSEFGAAAGGQIARLAGLVTPDIGVVLMVGLAHAGGFGGVEEDPRRPRPSWSRRSARAVWPCSTPTIRAS